jgi:5-methylthioadenosine/S-adenosylhomocysteine deaminase
VDLELTHRVLIPGLINAHVHSEYLLLKGMLEELRLKEWDHHALFQRAWTWIKAPRQLQALRAVYRASYLEMLLGGTTYVAEFNCSDESAPICREEMAAVGVKGLQTRRIVGRQSGDPTLEPGVQYKLREEELLTEDELQRASKLVREHAVKLTMHAAETEERVAVAKQRFGSSTVLLLDRYGLLGPRTLLSHAVHLTSQEMRIVAQRGAAVVASPACEMKLADGVAPTVQLLEMGVPVALGTDAAVCNNGADMFLEMRTAGLLHKLTRGAAALPARQALAMATLHGAGALGQGEERGCLEPGLRADMVAVDARSLRMRPVVHARGRSNLLPNLVFSATAADVSDVWVEGERVVAGRAHRSLDHGQVGLELDRLSLALQEHLGEL